MLDCTDWSAGICSTRAIEKVTVVSLLVIGFSDSIFQRICKTSQRFEDGLKVVRPIAPCLFAKILHDFVTGKL